MKRFLILSMLFVTLTAPLQAVYVAWQLTTKNGEAFPGTFSAENSSNISYQFVYSVSQLTTAKDVVEYANNTNNKGYVSGYGNGSNIFTGVMQDDNPGAYVNWTGLLTGSNNSYLSNPEITDGTGGWFYVIVFDAAAPDENTHYAVAGTQLTEYGANGIYSNTAGNTVTNAADYVDMNTWLAEATWSGMPTPEPTVVTLLALGVAGLALRRKV